MAGLLLTSEQIRTAPAEVRHWLKTVIDAEFELGALQEPAEHPRHELTACTLENAKAVLERIRSDYISTQVFFELGREVPLAAPSQGPLYRLSLPDIARHCRLRNFEHLAACLETITAAFREVRQDPEASLFASDQRGGLYIHEGTHSSIARLWHELVLGETGQATARSVLPMRAAATQPQGA